jgi:murein DD-endopeptidase MepM/ murein hydrolase activator NlpD
VEILKDMMGILRFSWSVLLILLIAACSEPVIKDNSPTPTIPLPAKSPRSSSTTTPLPSSTPTKTQTLPTPAKAHISQVCSPLDGISLEEIPDTIVNPYHPPNAGSDDPHQGVDFASRFDGDSFALEGYPVAAVLEGQVVSVLENRFPYGNAIMIEVALENLSRDTIVQLEIPTPAPTRSPHPSLTCPMEVFTSTLETDERSLYLLYAHLKDAAPYEPGEEIHCGQVLGATGSTGNALNPHLHLEVRVGPSDARFQSMAHYDTGATAEEMSFYCAWRVSDLFQLVDPMLLLK